MASERSPWATPDQVFPPAVSMAVQDPAGLLRLSLATWSAGLDVWLEGCKQAHELGLHALRWSEECLEPAGRER